MTQAARRGKPSARQLVDLLALPYRELIDRDAERAARWLSPGAKSAANLAG